MATISSMANNTYMMLTMAQNNGLSLFGNNSVSSSSKSNDIWSNYGNSSSAASAMLSGISEVSSSKRELLASYDSAAKEFKAEFGSTMKDLSSSIQDMKKLNLNVGEDAITKKSVTAEDGTTSTVTEYNKSMKEALGTIGEFVDNYNSAIDMFKDYGDVSKRMSYMGTVFGDTTARADTYAKIGLNVGSDGKITIDEEKLAKAIQDSPNRVENILGKDGLTGKAENHVNFAKGQEDKLFPSVDSMFGKQLKQASVYSGNSLLQLHSYANLGNFVNMMF
ncbi:MAG: flagellar filament capping protein FliD [Selenomonas sp.]|nr:flagellar filament capping protein FliD [Selenomonas sp.]